MNRLKVGLTRAVLILRKGEPTYRVASEGWDAGRGLTGQGQAHLKRGLSGARIHVDGALMRANYA